MKITVSIQIEDRGSFPIGIVLADTKQDAYEHLAELLQEASLAVRVNAPWGQEDA